MNTLHPMARVQTPAGFAKASRAYRVKVWMAMLGLVLFVLLYVGLASWFTYITYRMIAGVFAGGDGSVAAFLAALPAGFLAIFMWKALFFVRHGSNNPGREITPKDQPEFFAFLHELADELHAPRPHRVFLSPNVNACVVYDLSILNFFLPARKNLIIGLGLVNVLTRSEFKAVLAHEFGHFAQRSMAVGRWVYVGEQIAAHIIAKRDALDKTLDFISQIDLRVAWIGWIMRTIVWSIRSLMETAFRWVVIAHRALSREMEFQADLVAVSVTGSDALIHALYRLQPADEDWEQSLNFANSQLGKGRVVKDLFEVQTRVGQHMRQVLNEPKHGLVPERAVDDPRKHRLFTEQIAQPPKMWATHPPNTEREDNAKRVYIPAALDAESAWTLFQKPEELREQVTNLLFEGIKFEKDPVPLSSEEALAALDEQYSHETYNTRYQGTYLGRPLTIGVPTVSHLYTSWLAGADLAASLKELYPPSLQSEVAKWRGLEEEIAALEAIEAGYFDASGGVIRHRGRVIPRAELSELISQVKKERDEARSNLEEYDRNCRSAHDAAAKQVQQGWPEYLRSLTSLLHYAEHSEHDLKDAHGHLANITAMATATGRVSSKKLQKILASANDLQSVLEKLDHQAESIVLPESVLKELEANSWRDAFEKLALPPADEQNISQWMQVVDSWTIPMIRQFGSLRHAALAELLKAEQRVANICLGEAAPEPAPECAVVPSEYATRLRGSERVRQKKLDWWSRFTLADGTGPAVLRFVVATCIVAAVVIAGLYVGNANVIVYNGLSIPVTVSVHDQEVTLSPFQHKTLSVGARRRCQIIARAPDGREIESFEESLQRAFANYVYNIAGAGPMVEWAQAYGTATPPEPEILGFPRWRITRAKHIFENPPAQIETSGSGGTRRVLSSDAVMPAQYMLDLAPDPKERERAIRTHALWDSTEGKLFLFWMARANQVQDFDAILAERIKAEPDNVVLRRLEQDTAEGEEKERIRREHRELAHENPSNPDWQYLAIRAMPEGPEQDQAFMAALEKWPDNLWLSFAVAYHYATHAQWEKALAVYELPLKQSGALFDSTALVVARIRRILAADGTPEMNDLRGSMQLEQYLATETGENLQGTPALAYSLLHKGQVDEAYRVGNGGEGDPQLLVLLAASKGAPPEWQEQALLLKPEEVQHPVSLVYLAALAHRNGQPYHGYITTYETLYPQERKTSLDVIRQFIEKGSPGELGEEELTGLDPFQRGLAYSAALVMFPDAARESWRTAARALLFASERPAF